MIKIFVGPMASGKSKRVLDIYDNISNVKTVMCFKPNADTRSDNIKSRNGNGAPAISVSSFLEMLEIMKRLHTKDCIDEFIVDEVQFLDREGIVEFVKFVKTSNINVYIAGLNLTSEMTPFETTAHISMYADEIEFIKGKCIYCKSKSEITKCTVEKTSEILVGDDIYVSTCYNCY